MPATLAEIQRFRDTENKQMINYLSKCSIGSLSMSTITVAGVRIRIRGESDNKLSSIHMKSIRTAVEDVVGVGHRLPSLDFYLTSCVDVPNVAMKTYTAGTHTPVIFLGPKMWAKNVQMPKSAGAVVGGLGTAGPRGVADQAYDGTNRFFGNPKQKAQGATIVIHELGHVLHEHLNPGIFWEEMAAVYALARSPNAPAWTNEANKVSAYAMNNPLEFVAEVFAGRLIGKVYPDTTIAAYDALGGP